MLGPPLVSLTGVFIQTYIVDTAAIMKPRFIYSCGNYSLTAMVSFICACYYIFADWKKSPTYNTMEMKCIDDPSTLPVITLCNDNAFRKSELLKLNLEEFEGNKELHDALKQLKGRETWCYA